MWRLLLLTIILDNTFDRFGKNKSFEQVWDWNIIFNLAILSLFK